MLESTSARPIAIYIIESKLRGKGECRSAIPIATIIATNR